MDGLLIDTERQVWTTGEHIVAKQMGYNLELDFIRSLVGVNSAVYKERLQEKMGKDFPFIEFEQTMFKYYEEQCLQGNVSLMPGVKDLLTYLKKHDIKIALGTSTIRRIGETALKMTGIFDYFDYTVFGDEVKKGKPDPEIYLKSVEHFGYKPENCYVFEDSPNGAQAAIDGNINLVLVPDLIQPTELLKNKAFKILTKIDDIIPIFEKMAD